MRTRLALGRGFGHAVGVSPGFGRAGVRCLLNARSRTPAWKPHTRQAPVDHRRSLLGPRSSGMYQRGVSWLCFHARILHLRGQATTNERNLLSAFMTARRFRAWNRVAPGGAPQICSVRRERVMAELPLVGDEFAGYRLRAVLGRGGMSVVYQVSSEPRTMVISWATWPARCTRTCGTGGSLSTTT